MIREFDEKANPTPECMPEPAAHELGPVLAGVAIEASPINCLKCERVYGVAMGGDSMERARRGQV